jgi:signal transduction histidine kinase
MGVLAMGATSVSAAIDRRARAAWIGAVGWPWWLRVLVIAGAYYGAAKTGFAFAFATKQVTAIWPPTGLALAALVLGGLRCWPGVALGAFVANITASEPLVSALGITVGNTLEAVIGAWLLSRVPGFRASLERMRDVLALVVGAAVLSTLVSATIGVLSLVAGGVVGVGAFGSVWRVWWLGDLGGDVLVAPVLLVFGSLVVSRGPLRVWWESVAVAAAVAVVVAAVGVFVFTSREPLAYALFPVVFGVALRFRQPGAALSSLALACVAVWATKNGHGQFVAGSPDTELLRAQTFAGVIAITAMLVAAIRTERMVAEEQVALVERLVAERTQELSAANRELEAFSYSVSHDLRAPLRAIDGFSKAVIEDFEGKLLDAEGLRMLQRVRSASQRMAGLIDELLTLSRLTRKPMQRSRVDLTALAREIIAELSGGAPERAVQFEVQDGLVVDGDRELLRTAVRNLLENAWKFSSQRERPRVQFARAGTNGATAYVVRDNGVGFDMRYSEKLFRPFERLHTQAEFPGTGVGLTTVQRVVRRHGGTVWAEAHVDHGAAFYFTLNDRRAP